MRNIAGLEIMTPNTITRTFEHAKETKGTHQYKEIGDDIAVGTLYIKKSVLNGEIPDKVTVTIVW